MDAKIINVKKIVEEYLIKNNFDGLWSDECACILGDLMPCDDWGIDNCEPGYKRPCPKNCGEHDFHIGRKVETER